MLTDKKKIELRARLLQFVKNAAGKPPSDPNAQVSTEKGGDANKPDGQSGGLKPSKTMVQLPKVKPMVTEEKINQNTYKDPGSKSDTKFNQAPTGDAKGAPQQEIVNVNMSWYRHPEEKSKFKKQFKAVEWFKKEAVLTTMEETESYHLQAKEKRGEQLTAEELDKLARYKEQKPR